MRAQELRQVNSLLVERDWRAEYLAANREWYKEPGIIQSCPGREKKAEKKNKNKNIESAGASA